jgi:hypothetical protein
MSVARFIASGTAGGLISVLAFAVVHQILISDIWFSIVPMGIAGAVCGASIAWSYHAMFRPASMWSWLRYNMTYVGSLVLLSVVSVVVFEPVTTMAEVLALNDAPRELIASSMPLSIGFTVATIILLSVLYGSRPVHYLAIAVTTVLLIALLGLNVAVVGLVEIPSSGLFLIIEMFALIVVLDLVYVAAVLLIERRTFTACSAGVKLEEP